MRQRIADPVIRALREKVKETADEEIERVLRRLPHLSQTDRESIEFLSHAITGKLLHDATLKLKSAAEEGGHHEVFKLVAEMFGLDVELGADGSGNGFWPCRMVEPFSQTDFAALQGGDRQARARLVPGSGSAHVARGSVGLTRREVRVGTRSSELAQAQTRWVVSLLEKVAPDIHFTIQTIRTEGDLDQQTPLPRMGGRGVFVREVERRLLAGDVDFAVHSLKDLPTEETPGLVILSVPSREDPRDALVTQNGVDFQSLSAGAVIGTGSPRRRAQLYYHRPEIDFRHVRGNIDTRVRRVIDGELDGVILAVAGLRRAGITTPARPIPLEISLPAAGQGALALQARGRRRDGGAPRSRRQPDGPSRRLRGKGVARPTWGRLSRTGRRLLPFGSRRLAHRSVCRPSGRERADPGHAPSGNCGECRRGCVP